MFARSMLIAAALASATSAWAEPAKPQPQPADQPAARGAVILASAENVRVAPVATDPQAPQPVKRRAARVTSCRCAGQPTQEQ